MAGSQNHPHYPHSTRMWSLTDIRLFIIDALRNVPDDGRTPGYRGEPHGRTGRLQSQEQALSADFPSSPRERMSVSHRSPGRRPLISSDEDHWRKRNPKKSQRAVRDAIGRWMTYWSLPYVAGTLVAPGPPCSGQRPINIPGPADRVPGRAPDQARTAGKDSLPVSCRIAFLRRGLGCNRSEEALPRRFVQAPFAAFVPQA